MALSPPTSGVKLGPRRQLFGKKGGLKEWESAGMRYFAPTVLFRSYVVGLVHSTLWLQYPWQD